jgi:nitrate/nitrite transporter NarK
MYFQQKLLVPSAGTRQEAGDAQWVWGWAGALGGLFGKIGGLGGFVIEEGCGYG